jgi:hypothetical protein
MPNGRPASTQNQLVTTRLDQIGRQDSGSIPVSATIFSPRAFLLTLARSLPVVGMGNSLDHVGSSDPKAADADDNSVILRAICGEHLTSLRRLRGIISAEYAEIIHL